MRQHLHDSGRHSLKNSSLVWPAFRWKHLDLCEQLLAISARALNENRGMVLPLASIAVPWTRDAGGGGKHRDTHCAAEFAPDIQMALAIMLSDRFVVKLPVDVLAGYRMGAIREPISQSRYEMLQRMSRAWQGSGMLEVVLCSISKHAIGLCLCAGACSTERPEGASIDSHISGLY